MSERVAAWLLSDEARILDGDELIAGLFERIVAAGIPLWRGATSSRTMHPEVYVHNFMWRADRTMEVIKRPHGLLTGPFARQLGDTQLVSLGKHPLRGVQTEAELFTLPSTRAAPG